MSAWWQVSLLQIKHDFELFFLMVWCINSGNTPERSLQNAGATGGVGKRVVEVLLQQGRAVRALVRDEQKGKILLVGKNAF